MSAEQRKIPHRPRGAMFKLNYATTVNLPIGTVFEFFSDARNLDRITPPHLRFRTLTPDPIDMREGTRIEYALRLRGIPIRWESAITVWEPPHRFVDLQVRGPYRWWHHEHRFEEVSGGTRVIDEVEYACPGGWLVNKLFIRRDLERIFGFREQSLTAIFASTLNP